MTDEQIIQVEQEQVEQIIDIDSEQEEADINVHSESVEFNTDYEALDNKPSINGIELVGNKTTDELDIEIPTVPTKVSAFENDAGYLTEHQDISGKEDAFTVGDGLDMTSSVLSNPMSIEYIVGTQTEATNVWTGRTKDSSLKTGKIIAYYLPQAGTSSVAKLKLTLANGTETNAIELRRTATTTVTTQFAAGNVLILIYDGTYWKVSAYYDANTNTIGYQVRTNSSVLKTTDKCRYYKIFFTSADNTHLVPAAADSTNSATSLKTVNQRPINPFGTIVYCSANTSYAAEADVTATSIWQQYAFTLGYSFNRTGAALTLTSKAPVYIKCAPQADGSAIIDSTTPYVQALPTTEDGKIYIFLGIAYSATAIEMQMTHPVYQYKAGKICLYTGN